MDRLSKQRRSVSKIKGISAANQRTQTNQARGIGGNMFGIGMPELIIILVIILIIFGAGKLPEIGAGMGKAIRNFKGASDEDEKKTPEKIEEDEKKS
jgi:sec-independent protein translocase protein TatA